MSSRRPAWQRPGPLSQVRGDLHTQVLRQLRSGMAERRGLGFLRGPQGAVRLPACRTGDVALPLCAADAALPLRWHHGPAHRALARYGDTAAGGEGLRGLRVAPRGHEFVGVLPQDQQGRSHRPMGGQAAQGSGGCAARGRRGHQAPQATRLR